LVNNIPVGEFGLTALLGASFGVPTIMLSGDTAACKEFHVLVPQGECAEVKSGFNAASGTMLSHPAACALIREKARRAMERLSEFKAYKLNAPFEAKVQPEYTLGRNRDLLLLSRGAEALDDGWFVFRGNTYLEVYTKVVGP
jgi:D-amino peptidase